MSSIPSDQADTAVSSFGSVPKIADAELVAVAIATRAPLCESRRCELRRLPSRPPDGPVRGRPRDRPGEGGRPGLGPHRRPGREREHYRLPGVAEGDAGAGV